MKAVRRRPPALVLREARCKLFSYHLHGQSRVRAAPSDKRGYILTVRRCVNATLILYMNEGNGGATFYEREAAGYVSGFSARNFDVKHLADTHTREGYIILAVKFYISFQVGLAKRN